VDMLAYPLHRPMVCDHQMRGHSFLSDAAPSHRTVVGGDAFSRDATQLLHKTLTLVGWNTLHPIRVSLKKERKVFLCASGFLRAFSLPPNFVSVALVLG
jgi:hypothetical protein